jgi:hypothetical protein
LELENPFAHMPSEALSTILRGIEEKTELAEGREQGREKKEQPRSSAIEQE